MKRLKLTPKVLKSIIAEEKAKLESLGMLNQKDTSQVVEKHLQAIEKLSIKENDLRKKLKVIQEAKRKIKKNIINKSRK